jgi:hypothetical protein
VCKGEGEDEDEGISNYPVEFVVPAVTKKLPEFKKAKSDTFL